MASGQASWYGRRLVGRMGRRSVRRQPRCFRFETTVPGGARVPTAGYSRVGVLPTHTRQGLLTQLMQRSLREAHERGHVLASLRASEAPIYGRFGYGLAGDFVAAHITSDANATAAGRPRHRIDATAPRRRGVRRRAGAVRACRPSLGRHDRPPRMDVEALPEGGDRAGVGAVRQGRVRRRAHRHRRCRRRIRALRDRVAREVRDGVRRLGHRARPVGRQRRRRAGAVAVPVRHRPREDVAGVGATGQRSDPPCPARRACLRDAPGRATNSGSASSTSTPPSPPARTARVRRP